MRDVDARQAHLKELLFVNDDEHFPMPRQRVGKLAAARRNLDAALRAWFANEDPLAVHTLIAAAHEVLSDVAAARGLADALYDSPRIKPEYRALWHKAVRAPANFLKHANRDPDAEFDFHPRLNDLRLMYCLRSLESLGEEVGDLGRAYAIRIGLEYPDLLMRPLHEGLPGSTADDWAQLARMSRPRYLKVDQAMRSAGKVGIKIRIVDK